MMSIDQLSIFARVWNWFEVYSDGIKVIRPPRGTLVADSDAEIMNRYGLVRCTEY